jgi:putative cell wall-binding protein
VLLVQSDSVPSATVNELRRLDPSQIVVVGGPAVIDDTALADLERYLP